MHLWELKRFATRTRHTEQHGAPAPWLTETPWRPFPTPRRRFISLNRGFPFLRALIALPTDCRMENDHGTHSID